MEYGCGTLETVHHIMAECPELEQRRLDITKKMIAKATDNKNKSDWRQKLTAKFIKQSRLFMKDSTIWPLGVTQFYLGHVPGAIPKEESRDRETLKALKKIHDELHYAGIRLAGRIYGHHAKTLAKLADDRE